MSIVGDALTILQIIATLHDYYSVFTGNRERCRLLCERCYVFEAPMKALTQNRSKHSHISAASVSQLLKTLRDCREFLRKFTKESWFRFCKNAMLAKSIEGEFKALNQRLLQSSNDLQLPIHIDTKAEVVAMAQDMKQLLMKQERVCESGMIINDDVKIQLHRQKLELRQQGKGLTLIEAMYSKMALFERVLGDLYDKQMESSAALMELAEASDADAESSLKEAADDRMESKVPSMEYYLRHVVRLDERLLEWNDNDAASKIGEGSFGVVYRCIYGGRDCAVKKFHSIERATDSDMRRLAKEARIMDLVSHPYIIEFWGLSFERGLLVMERAVCSMWDLLYSNKSPAELGVPSSYTFDKYDKLNALSQVALAMYYLHTRKVLHRDIKPDNILFVYDPRKQPQEQFVAKLADFGIAVAVGFTTFGSASSSKATGTYMYMAPELLSFEGEPQYSTASDMYALGITINEALVGQRPWITPAGMILQQVQVAMKVCVNMQRPTILKDEENKLDGLVELIGGRDEGCWAHDPSLRPQAEKVAQELKTLLSSLRSSRDNQVKGDDAAVKIVFDDRHQQALDAAVDRRDVDEMQKLLQIYIDDAAKAEWKKEYGDECWSMLHIACSCNDIRSIVLILDNDAIVDVRNKAIVFGIDDSVFFNINEVDSMSLQVY